MADLIPLSGIRFTRLLVIGPAYGTGKRPRFSGYWWLCRCDCGTEIIALGGQLRFGSPKSCGCLSREITSQRNYKHGHRFRKMRKSAEYETWKGIRKRCSVSKEHQDYKYYAGRGIKVCERWSNFETFLADMGPRPSNSHSLDRIDPDGNYEPSNCRWATPVEQANNKRDTKRHLYNGAEKTLREIWDVEPSVVSLSIFSARVNTLKWPIAPALITPANEDVPRENDSGRFRKSYNAVP